jgi:hypothetical protein
MQRMHNNVEIFTQMSKGIGQGRNAHKIIVIQNKNQCQIVV